MAITARQALDIQISRGLTVELTRGGWITRTEGGTRVRVEPAATPEAAIETAEAHLSAREAEQVERSSRRLVGMMQRGDHYHRPHTVRDADPEMGDRIVFDLIRVADEVIVVTGAASVAEAWTAERVVADGAGGVSGGAPR